VGTVVLAQWGWGRALSPYLKRENVAPCNTGVT
jgi:hypothetical protein